MVIAPPYKPVAIESFFRDNGSLFENAQITVSAVDAQGTSFFDPFREKELTDREFKVLGKRCVEGAGGARRDQVNLLRFIMMENTLLKIYMRDIGRRLLGVETLFPVLRP